MNYEANGLTPAEVLQGANKDAVSENNVNSEYVTNLSTNQLAYRKKGTCKIRLQYVEKTNVGESGSPQYNDGKERVPVHYTV